MKKGFLMISETNTTTASAAGRGDKKSRKRQENSPRNSSAAGGNQGAGNPPRKYLCGSMLDENFYDLYIHVHLMCISLKCIFSIKFMYMYCSCRI